MEPISIAKLREILRGTQIRSKRGGLLPVTFFYRETPLGSLDMRPFEARFERDYRTTYATFLFPYDPVITVTAPYYYCLKSFKLDMADELLDFVTRNTEVKYFSEKDRKRIRKNLAKMKEVEPWLNADRRSKLDESLRAKEGRAIKSYSLLERSELRFII